MLIAVKQAIVTSVHSLLNNKIRSFLTMLGIIIGVGAVIVIMSVGAGAQSLILKQVESLGTNIIGVFPGKSEENSPPAGLMGIVITTLTDKDVLAIKNPNNVTGVIDAVGYTRSMENVIWKNKSYETNISGCTTGYMLVEGGEIAKGRFFTKKEEKNLSKVVVLGSVVKKELFGDQPAIGERIRIKRHTFEVIGVMKKRGTVAFQDYDDQVFVPLKTMQKLIAGVNHLGIIRVKIDSKTNIKQAMADIAATLREQHNINDNSGDNDDFTVRSADDMLVMITTITNALKYFLAAMAALSLLVGGIGIMNIMLINVRERTREIGLRKALGANNKNILNQFLIEAITITVVGGIVGIFVGVIISYIIYLGVNFFGYDWSFMVSFFSIISSFSVAFLIGLLFGIYPAFKAAKLEPVEALRYE